MAHIFKVHLGREGVCGGNSSHYGGLVGGDINCSVGYRMQTLPALTGFLLPPVKPTIPPFFPKGSGFRLNILGSFV